MKTPGCHEGRPAFRICYGHTQPVVMRKKHTQQHTFLQNGTANPCMFTETETPPQGGVEGAKGA